MRKLRTTLMTVTATTYYRVVRDTRNKCASWLVFFSSCRVSPLPELDHFVPPGFLFSVDGMDGICICRQDRQIRSPRAPPARPTRLGAPTRSVHLANVFFSPSQNKQALQQ